MGDLVVSAPPVVVPGAARVLTPELERDAGRKRSNRMDGVRELFETAREKNLAAGRFRGLLHIAIGRTVARADGTKLSAGLTWREVAALLKVLRYDTELGREAGADPETLSPRDRERYWYAVIALARVDGPDALAEAEALIGPLKALGFVVAPSASAPPPSAPPAKAKPKPEEKPKKKKK
jgi:hypothetical protein